MNVCDKYKNEIRQCKAIEYAGLRLQPLKVSDYALFLSAKPSFELMQASLPPKLARLSWMPCLDALDKKYKEETGKEGGYLATALLVIATAIQPGFTDEPRLIIETIRNEEGKPVRISVREDYTSMPVYLSCQQMSELRQIIAAQNGYRIPDENWNLELMKAQKYLETQQNGKIELKADIEALVCSVAANTGCRPKEIWDWSIREFTRMQEAIDRSLGFRIYRAAELNGARFEGGSPFPTWKYSRETLPTGSRMLDDVESTAGPMLAKVTKE